MPMLPRAGPKMLPWSNAHHIACPLRQSCRANGRPSKGRPTGSYFPGRRVAVTPYSLTKVGIPGFRKSAIMPPSPLYPAISPRSLFDHLQAVVVRRLLQRGASGQACATVQPFLSTVSLRPAMFRRRRKTARYTCSRQLLRDDCGECVSSRQADQCTLLKLLTILFYNRIAACRPRTIVLRSGGSSVRSFRPKQKAHFVACFQIGRRVWIVGTSYKIESRLLKHSHIAAMSSIGNCVTPAGLVLMSISSFIT